MIEAIATLIPHTFKNNIAIGEHVVQTDVPTDLGGTNTGPQPHDLLGAALAACTSTTLQMYAQRKNWPLESLIVKVSVSKEGDTEVFQRHIQVRGPLDDEQRLRLLDMANKCPVHKILSGKIEVVTALV